MTIPHKMPTVAALSPGVALSSLFSNQSGFHNVQNALGTPAAVSYLTRAQAFERGFYMNLCGVQQRNSGSLPAPQDQRQLGTAENYCLYAVPLFHSRDDTRQCFASLVRKHSIHKFAEVFFVDVSLIALIRHMDPHLLPGEYLWIEARLHREASSKQADTLKTRLVCAISHGLHNAEERNRRTRLHFIEHNVWRVGRDQREVGAGSHQLFQLEHKKLSQILKSFFCRAA